MAAALLSLIRYSLISPWYWTVASLSRVLISLISVKVSDRPEISKEAYELDIRQP